MSKRLPEPRASEVVDPGGSPASSWILSGSPAGFASPPRSGFAFITEALAFLYLGSIDPPPGAFSKSLKTA
jgi:hypothetical protein